LCWEPNRELMLGILPNMAKQVKSAVPIGSESEVIEGFGQRLRGLRSRAGLSQRALAGRVGIDFTYLSKLENDRGEPPGEGTIRRLAICLQADPDELLAVAGKVPPELKGLAAQDPRFALLLRRLPTMAGRDLDEFYRRARVPEQILGEQHVRQTRAKQRTRLRH